VLPVQRQLSRFVLTGSRRRPAPSGAQVLVASLTPRHGARTALHVCPLYLLPCVLAPVAASSCALYPLLDSSGLQNNRVTDASCIYDKGTSRFYFSLLWAVSPTPVPCSPLLHFPCPLTRAVTCHTAPRSTALAKGCGGSEGVSALPSLVVRSHRGSRVPGTAWARASMGAASLWGCLRPATP